MIDIAALRAMAAAGATVEVILAAIEADQKSSLEKLNIRRAKDAERQRRNRNVRNRHADSRGPSDGVCDTPAHIDSTLTVLTNKKVSKKTISAPLVEVPLDASERDRTYAASKGWDARKTASEWERFRNNSLAKGKRHRNVDAAWRNWVTSPFQAQGASNGRSGTSGGRISPITAALNKHLERFEDQSRDGDELREAPPRLLSNG